MEKLNRISKIRRNSIIFLCSILNSCVNSELEINYPCVEENMIVIESFTHSTIIDQIEYLHFGSHDEYLQPEIIVHLKNDAFLSQKLYETSLLTCDTIFFYDEIPMVKETNSHTCILQDGTWQSITEHQTPYKANTIFQLSENPPSEESRITKTEVRDGKMKIYNHDGKLIGEELYPVADMREFLDTIKSYIILNSERVKDKKLDINQKLLQMKNQLPDVNNAMRLTNGNVIIENNLVELPIAIKNNSSSYAIIKSRTELSKDMTKVLKYELFQGNYLVERKTYTYSHKVALQNFHNLNVLNDNPETIESERLILNAKGFPVLHHTKEYFVRNQVYYYF